MDFEMAQQLLGTCVKYELRDHAFGDVEVEWTDGDIQVASGYFGGENASVSVTYGPGPDHFAIFKGDEAHKLRSCFIAEQIERNDESGPEEFELGKVMPGLTNEGVRKELMGE